MLIIEGAAREQLHLMDRTLVSDPPVRLGLGRRGHFARKPVDLANYRVGKNCRTEVHNTLASPDARYPQLYWCGMSVAPSACAHCGLKPRIYRLRRVAAENGEPMPQQQEIRTNPA